MSDGLRLWWVEMEPRLLPIAAIIVGVLATLAFGAWLFRSNDKHPN
jgi:hypothetical protein